MRNALLLLAAVAATAQADKFSFVVAGDGRADSKVVRPEDKDGVNTLITGEIAQAVVAEQAKFLMWTGDLVFGYEKDPAKFEQQLLTWRNLMSPVYENNIPVLACRGNHEAGSTDSEKVWRKVFSGRYAMPNNGPDTEKNLSFFFGKGDVLAIGLDQYIYGKEAVNQPWLDKVLAQYPKKFIFAMGHEPAFMDGSHKDTMDANPEQRDAFWESIIRAGARVFFCGHDHLYDHMLVTRTGDNPGPPVHQVVAGTAGAPFYKVGDYAGNNTTWNLHREKHIDNTYGYLLVQIDGTKATVTFKGRVAPGRYVAMDSFSYSVGKPLPKIQINQLEVPVPESPKLEKRWVYLATNLWVDKNIDQNILLMERAKKAGYNGVVLTDSKFFRWEAMGQHYKDNAARFRSAVKKLGMECIVCVAPIGYSNDLLSKDPNLAEGLPVENAPFRATETGTLVPEADDLKIVDGDFEDGFTGWAWHDPACTLDGGTLKMSNGGGANARASQPLRVQPHRNYHVSARVKTQDFESTGSVNILFLAKNGQALQHRLLPIDRTMGWRTIDVTFNTLDNTEVNFYVGVWGMGTGSIWWDDVRLEPAGLVNLIRRPGAPFKVTSSDGRTTYKEDIDFKGAFDPKTGNVQWLGDYDVWHQGPTMTIPKGSRIRSGDQVLVSYCHTALIGDGQAMVCMAEPNVDKYIASNIHDIHQFLQPDGYFLSHDEIRMTGWDASCLSTGKKPGQILADNVRKCIAIVRKEDAGKTIYAWSDMFDPTHNAKPTGPYYLVKGDGPWSGSWQGLDKDVVIVNWNSDPALRKKSFAFFAERGHKQILAGYYDGPVDSIKEWLKDSEALGGLAGVMFTTWQSNFKDLESFAKALAERREMSRR